MTIAWLLPPRLSKEIRGLLPAWLLCLVSMMVAATLGNRGLFVGMVGYLLGAVALGGLSMGHEYNCRTLTLLLSQPARRERLFLEKLGVLAVMLLVLCAFAWLGVFEAVPWGRSVRWVQNWWILALVLPLLCGFFLAPWLTMVCRSALAGIVFALAIPGTMWVASDITSAMIYGGDLSALAEAGDFAVDIFWRGMVILCMVAAACSWWMFVRLEAIDDSRGLEVRLPAWLPWRTAGSASITTAPPFATRHAIWLLAKKELRLQQLTFAVSGLYIIGWIAILLFKPVSLATRATLFYTLTVFHSGAIPLLAGSLASAEERQLGTLEWQVLLPMAGWKQWQVKAGMALGIALILTFGLPALLFHLHATPAMRADIAPLRTASFAYAVVVVVVATLYVSSLCANGLRALLTSVPVMLLTMGSYLTMSRMLDDRFFPYRTSGMFGLFETRLAIYRTLMDLLRVIAYIGVIGMLLRFGLANHRLTERGARRISRQVIALVAFLAVGGTLWFGVSRLYAASMTEWIRSERSKWASVSGLAMDGSNQSVKDYSVAVFEDRAEGLPVLPPARAGFFINASKQGTFEIGWLRPGRYAFVAVERLAVDAPRDSAHELLNRLRPLAVPLTVAAGDAKVLSLRLLTRADLQP